MKSQKFINKVIMMLIIASKQSVAISVYPPIESISGAPAQHDYKSLDFGASNINGQRIQIRSNAPAGSAVNTSQLNINNAGVQAGFIEPTSHFIEAGSSCSSDQMGMISQQLTNGVIVTSQLQCMYNPTFCSSPGYCYLPIKTSKFIYKYEYLRTLGQCATGTIVDSNQPSYAVSTLVSCPNISGWRLTQGVHGVGVNCYRGATGMSYCTGYETVCNYVYTNARYVFPRQVAVVALSALQCTNASTTFILDNYTP